jgi:hypothetical protein
MIVEDSGAALKRNLTQGAIGKIACCSRRHLARDTTGTGL